LVFGVPVCLRQSSWLPDSRTPLSSVRDVRVGCCTSTRSFHRVAHLIFVHSVLVRPIRVVIRPPCYFPPFRWIPFRTYRVCYPVSPFTFFLTGIVPTAAHSVGCIRLCRLAPSSFSFCRPVPGPWALLAKSVIPSCCGHTTPYPLLRRFCMFFNFVAFPSTCSHGRCPAFRPFKWNFIRAGPLVFLPVRHKFFPVPLVSVGRAFYAANADYSSTFGPTCST